MTRKRVYVYKAQVRASYYYLFYISMLIGILLAYVFRAAPQISLEYSNRVTRESGNLLERQCADMISKANHSIHMQCYNFESIKLAHSLIDAQKRGVTVTISFDKERSSKHSEAIKRLRRSIKDIYISTAPHKNHQKIMVIDSYISLIGSYNFKPSRDNDVVFVIKDKEVAKYFIKNWHLEPKAQWSIG